MIIHFLFSALLINLIGAFQIGSLDHPLSINRPSLVVVGEKVTFSCILATTADPIGEACQLTAPTGAEWSVDVGTGVVLSLIHI